MNNDVVIIELDRPRELRYGHKALKTMVAMTGKDMEKIIDSDDMNLEDIEKIIYCGLLSDARINKEELKLEQMEDLLDLKPYGYILEKMNEAFTASFGESEEQPKVKELEEGKNDQGIAQK